MYQVLIVEDDPMVAMINEQFILKNRSFQVAGKCRNGKSALDFLHSHPVDLIILDVYMPQMDGLETLRQIRAEKLAVDIIMVTAANERESLESALHLGVMDYLVKPFTYERFQMALEKFIMQRRALQETDKLNQREIDYIVESNRRKNDNGYPKGIQEKTLHLITDYLELHSGEWVTGDQIAGETGLTVVTVRRYMSFLMDSGKASGEMNYETGGRPCMTYCLKNF